MVAVWNQKINPWGPTGGNPMVQVTFQGRLMWSYYRYPSKFPLSGNAGTVPNRDYQKAWDAMYKYYVEDEAGPKLPTYDMVAKGYTFGSEEVPGFTYNSTTQNNVFTTTTVVPPFAPPGGKG